MAGPHPMPALYLVFLLQVSLFHCSHLLGDTQEPVTLSPVMLYHSPTKYVGSIRCCQRKGVCPLREEVGAALGIQVSVWTRI